MNDETETTPPETETGTPPETETGTPPETETGTPPEGSTEDPTEDLTADPEESPYKAVAALPENAPKIARTWRARLENKRQQLKQELIGKTVQYQSGRMTTVQPAEVLDAWIVGKDVELTIQPQRGDPKTIGLADLR